MRLTIVKPKKQKTPVAVGAQGAEELPAGEELSDGEDLSGDDLAGGEEEQIPGDEAQGDHDHPVDAGLIRLRRQTDASAELRSPRTR